MRRSVVGDGWEMRFGKWQDFPPDSCDHCLSDPPFTDHVSAKAKQRVGLYNRQTGQVEPHSVLPSHVTTEQLMGDLSFGGVSERELGPELVQRVLRWTVLFCAIEQIGGYAEACPEHWVRGCWWSKTNPSPQFTGDRPGTPGETIAVLHAPGKKRWNRGGHAGEWRGARRNHGEPWDERVHETQKPLWLMRDLVLAFTDPGETIWDPYAGSATTGVACLLTGRRFLGHELQERYFDVSCERLEAAAMQQPLADRRAGQLSFLPSAPVRHADPGMVLGVAEPGPTEVSDG